MTCEHAPCSFCIPIEKRKAEDLALEQKFGQKEMERRLRKVFAKMCGVYTEDRPLDVIVNFVQEPWRLLRAVPSPKETGCLSIMLLHTRDYPERVEFLVDAIPYEMVDDPDNFGYFDWLKSRQM